MRKAAADEPETAFEIGTRLEVLPLTALQPEPGRPQDSRGDETACMFCVLGMGHNNAVLVWNGVVDHTR